MTSTSALSFGTLPTTDESLPTVSDIRAACTDHPGQWTVALRADRMARAETYRDAVNDGTKLGPHFRAEIRKEGPVFRVFVTYSPRPASVTMPRRY